MPRVNPIQTAVNAGELSPRMAARVDFAKYPNGAARLENMLPLPQGGLARRPGTRFVVETKDSQKTGGMGAGAEGAREGAARLGRFQFSTRQAYILEMGEGYIRFCRNQGQIVAETVSARITNGSFTRGLSGWTNDSRGTGKIEQRAIGQKVFGTWDAAINVISTQRGGLGQLGDGYPNARNIGFSFTPTASGRVREVLVRVYLFGSGPFNAVAKVYRDSGGSPGSRVGGDSRSLAMAVLGEKAFTWSSNAPHLTAGTKYWIVLSDTSTTPHSSVAYLGVVNDQGAAFETGQHDTIGSISDASGAFPSTLDLHLRVTIADDGAKTILNLIGAGAGNEARATQRVAIAEADRAHALRFRVLGTAADRGTLRIGTASGGSDILKDRKLQPGWYVVSFRTAAAAAFVQFESGLAKTVSIGDVEILSNAPIEVGSPYLEAELDGLKFAQSADVLYIAHPNRPVMKLERRGHDDWALIEVAWQDGPYLDSNPDIDKRLTMAAGTGLGVACSATGHAPFKATDVGRPLRMTSSYASAEWGWGIIAGFTSPGKVTVDILRAMPTGATNGWSLGAWSETTGYPTTIGFHEQRLVAAGSAKQPQTLWLSQSADIENMRPDSFEAGANETQDDDGLSFTIAADDVNRILWISSGSRLAIGTSGGEWTATSEGSVITPSDIDVKRQTTHGSADTAPVRVSDVVLFLQRALRKIREFAFRFETDNFNAPDLTILSDHITRSGIKEMVWQQEPDSVVWCRRADGGLAALTYKREQDVVGWGRQVPGGAFGGGAAVVEAVETIPGNDAVTPSSEDRDEVWLIVKRTIDGATKRYIEVLTGLFEGPNREEYDSDAAFDRAVLAAQADAVYLDAALTYDGAPVTSISGLDHLEGETVKIWADGAIQPDQTVTGGAIVLESAASKAHVGLGYRHVFKSLKIDAGAAAGTAVGKKKRIHAVTFVLLHTHSLRAGPSLKDQQDVGLREVGDAMDGPAPLFTGEADLPFDGSWEPDARIVVSGDDPAPFTLLAIAPEMKTNEGP